MKVVAGLGVAVLVSAVMGAPLEAAETGAPMTMDAMAERYVKLVLALGTHDKDYVDAYYGPPEWQKEVEAARQPVSEVRAGALALLKELERLAPAAGSEEIVRLRHQYVVRQLESLVARADLLSGRKMSFDEESQALYDAVAPTHGEAYFKNLAREIDAALPGPGSLVTRYAAFRDQFNVPKDKVDAVFKAAIAECRRRTVGHVALPESESFIVEYVTGKSWSAYNWYQGGYKSLIQVNVEQPISIDRATDLACHEGYPGHHVYNVLLEKNLVRDRGWKEFTVYPLFSPQSLIAEGTANYGIEVAFPGDERAAFEQKVLFPLAGLDPTKAAGFHRVQQLAARLSYAGNEAARLYLEGRTDAAGATAWLEAYGLSAAAKAQQRIRFFDQYRSYVINYNLGQDLVRAYIESRGGTPANPQKRWEEFKGLLASPRLPGGLGPIAVR